MFTTTNTNPDTGIRYGTIYLNHLDGDVANDLWMNGENVSEKEAYAELKSEIERDADNIEQEVYDDFVASDPMIQDFDEQLESLYEGAYLRLGYNDRDDYIETRLELESQNIEIDEPTIEGECEGVKYAISWLGGAPLLWIFESPVISKARLCSPCVPNAGDLDSLDDDGYECYGIPSDWRCKEV